VSTGTSTRRVTRIDLGSVPPSTVRLDTLAAEDPLEIRVGGRPLAVTMRTPGDDLDLAAGFLLGEGVIAGASDLASLAHAPARGGDPVNSQVVDAVLAAGVPAPDPSVERSFYTSSSCGICGKASLEAVRTASSYGVRDAPLRVSAEVLAGLPETLRAAQRVFAQTGGLHGAALFDASGGLLCLREDVGRHNAVDKVAGWALRAGLLPLASSVLLVSGRASFELAQKALMAGVPVLAAVSAPSSLAVDLAEETGMTLVGFLRGDTMNVYSGRQRVRTGEA